MRSLLTGGTRGCVEPRTRPRAPRGTHGPSLGNTPLPERALASAHAAAPDDLAAQRLWRQPRSDDRGRRRVAALAAARHRAPRLEAGRRLRCTHATVERTAGRRRRQRVSLGGPRGCDPPPERLAGRAQRRGRVVGRRQPLHRYRLRYLLTAWGGSTTDEHRLLSS